MGDLVPLTRKQEGFCRAYVANNGNGTLAAKQAGYSEKTAYAIASENLRKPHLKDRIQEIEQAALDVNQITPELVKKLILNEAMTAESDGARATNLKTLALSLGMLKENVQVSEKMPDDQIVEALREAGLDEDAAKQMLGLK